MKDKNTGAVMTWLLVAVIAGVVVAGSARHASAGISFQLGAVYCHIVAAGPLYFHSGISRPWLSSDSRWFKLDGTARRRLERRVLDGLAVKFAGFVAERHDADALLSPRCDLVRGSATSAEEMIDAAVYFRAGTAVPYPAAGKIDVEWVPDFYADLNAALSKPVALVIGNNAYQAPVSSLSNSVDDAVAVSAALGRLGFDVTTLVDADAGAMIDALRTFRSEIPDVRHVVLFYSGHGVTVDGSQYLIPIDAGFGDPDGETAEAASLESLEPLVSLDEVVEATAGARARILILDADFPSGRPGGFRMVGRRDVLVAYAAAPGERAFAQAVGNSPYTTALLRHLERPGLELSAMFRAVASDVFASTSGNQVPAVYSSLTSPVTLLPAASDDPALAVPDYPK